MKIQHGGVQVRLTHDRDSGSMAIYDTEGEMIDRVDAAPPTEPFRHNMVWARDSYMATLTDQGIARSTGETETLADGSVTHQLEIVHPDFHDDGYSCFGDFARNSLGEQCQYASRHIDGRMDGYEALGEGLRFQNVGSGDYHSIRIHRDDMAEFGGRYIQMKARERTC